TRRNGKDADVYIQDAAPGARPRLVLPVAGETCQLVDFSPDGGRAVIEREVSETDYYARILDVATGAVSDVPSELDPARPLGADRVARRSFRFRADGKGLVFLSAARGEHLELARMDLATGKTDWPCPALDGDVEAFDLARDRRRAALLVNA